MSGRRTSPLARSAMGVVSRPVDRVTPARSDPLAGTVSEDPLLQAKYRKLVRQHLDGLGRIEHYLVGLKTRLRRTGRQKGLPAGGQAALRLPLIREGKAFDLRRQLRRFPPITLFDTVPKQPVVLAVMFGLVAPPNLTATCWFRAGAAGLWFREQRAESGVRRYKSRPRCWRRGQNCPAL